ncbi:MAG: hypothetical protein GY863_04225 [bacterium]|nr:hypothetical protein [bacterium]
MNTIKIITFLFVFAGILLISCSTEEGFPALTGKYLSQEPPGRRPIMFAPGIISTAMNEFGPTFSPDGEELYYALQVKTDIRKIRTIAMTKTVNETWIAPELASFAGKYSDTCPAFHPDGSRLFFQTDRPVTGEYKPDESWSIWYVERNGNDWSEPKPAGQAINGMGNTFAPSLSMNGNMYFTAQEEGWEGIFRSKFANGEYMAAEKLPAHVNTTNAQFHSFIAPDESYLVISVYGREDAIGSTDYYASFRDKDDNWSEIVNLGETINSDKVEASPYITPDGRYFFYMGWSNYVAKPEPVLTYDFIKRMQTEPGYGSLDIYWIDAKVIEDLRPDNFK